MNYKLVIALVNLRWFERGVKMDLYRLEVENNNELLGLLTGDEVLISTTVLPIGNGKDIGLFEVGEETFLSCFTRYGSQILFFGDRMRVEKAHHVIIRGKVIDVKSRKKVHFSN